MIHISSTASLSTKQKKRRVSITKNKLSSQKITQNGTQLTKKVSHKQSKNKILIKQNSIDQQQYNQNVKKIGKLNDRLFMEALQKLEYKQANKILQQIKQLVNNLGNELWPQQKVSVSSFIHLSLQQSICTSTVIQKQLLIDQMINKEVLNKWNSQLGTFKTLKDIFYRDRRIQPIRINQLNLIYSTLLLYQMQINTHKQQYQPKNASKNYHAICAQNLVYSDTPDTIATQGQSRVKTQKVNFKRIVIKQAQKLLKQIEISSPHKLMTQNKQKFEQKLKNMYFWKNNLQNNVKLAQKELLQKGKQTSSNRNLLGVQKTSNFTQQFSLGQLMSLNTRKMKDKLNTDQYFLLSSPKITQMVLFASVCYFTIATETRFKQIDSDIKSLKITQKYQKLNKDEIIFRCKVLHLKAIQLAAKYLPQTNSYFKHILNSFNNNYKFMLDQINQQSETSMKSYNKSLEKYRKQAEAQQDGLNQQYGISNVHSQNMLHASSKTQKRQIYQKNQKLQKSVHQHSIIQTIKKRTVSKDKQTLSKRKVSVSKK